MSLTSADNNADLSVTSRNAEIVIQADPGASGHIEVVQAYRHVVIGEPTSDYNGQQVLQK